MSLYTTVSDMLQAVREGVVLAGGGDVSRYGVVNGDLAWDACCEGALHAVPLRIYPSRTFPQSDATPASIFCGSLTVHEVAVVVLRCAPVGNQRQAKPPTPEELDASAQIMLNDANAVVQALQCWIQDYDEDAVIRDTIFVGPEGGCVGSSTTVMLEIG